MPLKRAVHDCCCRAAVVLPRLLLLLLLLLLRRPRVNWQARGAAAGRRRCAARSCWLLPSLHASWTCRPVHRRRSAESAGRARPLGGAGGSLCRLRARWRSRARRQAPHARCPSWRGTRAGSRRRCWGSVDSARCTPLSCGRTGRARSSCRWRTGARRRSARQAPRGGRRRARQRVQGLRGRAQARPEPAPGHHAPDVARVKFSAYRYSGRHHGSRTA